MPVIRVENVIKTYDVNGRTIRAVSGAFLDVLPGDFISIEGHPGSGKTTLLSMICGIMKPTSGKVLFKGTDIAEFSSDRISEYRCRTIGLIFKFSSLAPNLTVKDNLLLSSVFSAKNEPDDTLRSRLKARELLHLVGLGDKADVYPDQLSGGQQRLAAVARTFMGEPEIILADEPTRDLDDKTGAEIMEFFTHMNSTRNTTFIMVTHNRGLLQRAKRRLKMEHGAISEIWRLEP